MNRFDLKWKVEAAYTACVARYVETGSPGSLQLMVAVLNLLGWATPPTFWMQGA